MNKGRGGRGRRGQFTSDGRIQNSYAPRRQGKVKGKYDNQGCDNINLKFYNC